MKLEVAQPPRTAMELFKILPEGTLAEVINGNFYLSPSPLSRHQIVLNKINFSFQKFFEQHPVGGVYISPLDVYLDESRNAVQPDLIIILNENSSILNPDGHIHGVPDLLVEVLSDGNNQHDLIVKKELYEKFGVKEYWIVNPVSKETTIFFLVNGQYQLVSKEIAKANSRLLKNIFVF
jgi:Uma2 family endonuclease